jgi:hypothetical protein
MGNKKRKLILSLFVTFTIIILFFIGKNVLFYTHQLTPEGEKLLNTERIQKDVEYIFQDKYKFHYKLSIFNLKNIIHLSLEPNRTVLKRAFQNESDKVIQIVLTDKKVRGTDINVHEEGKVIVTNQAIQFLIYFIHRDYDPTIKAVNAFYTPRNFGIDANADANCVIIIDEFKDEYKRLKNDGLVGKKLEKKLEEKFIYYDGEK